MNPWWAIASSNRSSVPASISSIHSATSPVSRRR
jgi:hypothetical protein